jgi:regulator of protease activity HflC (stomatin/prohibitin superfamily)
MPEALTPSSRVLEEYERQMKEMRERRAAEAKTAAEEAKTEQLAARRAACEYPLHITGSRTPPHYS